MISYFNKGLPFCLKILFAVLLVSSCSIDSADKILLVPDKDDIILPNIAFVYDSQVKYYENYYSKTDKKIIQNIFKRKTSLLDSVVSYIRLAGMHPELVAVAIVETKLDPKAVSSYGKNYGLWQLSPTTALMFGLSKNDLFDSSKSTVAACRYLRRLFYRFRSWELALAAYNAGPTRVSRLLSKHNISTFKELNGFNDFPKTTKEYVYKVIAVMNILSNPEFFGFVRPENYDNLNLGNNLQMIYLINR